MRRWFSLCLKKQGKAGNPRRGTCAKEALIGTFHSPRRRQLSVPYPQESLDPPLTLQPDCCCVPRIGLQSRRDQGRLPPASSSPTLARRTSQPKEPPLLPSEFPPRRLGGTFLLKKSEKKNSAATYHFLLYLQVPILFETKQNNRFWLHLLDDAIFDFSVVSTVFASGLYFC